MSPFNRLHNWMARRNIGKWLGMTSDPDRDSAYQSELDADRACMTELAQRVRLELADQALANGRLEEAEEFASSALGPLQEIADSGRPGVPELITRARRVLAKAPPETPVPQPRPVVSTDEMWATFIAITALYDMGRLAEARQLWTTAMRSQIVGDRETIDRLRESMAAVGTALTEAEQASKPGEAES